MNVPERVSQRGAVHTMWLVTIMIFWLGTLALLYLANDDVAASAQAASDAQARRVAAEARLDEELAAFKALSDVVGYTDPTNANSRTNIAALRTDLDGAKAAVGAALGGPETNVTVDQGIKALLVSLAAAVNARTVAEGSADTERGARADADRRVAALDQQYQAQVAQLRKDLADEQQRGATQAANADRQLAELRSQQQEADALARSTQQELDDATLNASRAAATAESTLRAVAAQRAPTEPEQPDGEILSVSANGSLAWVDLGSRHALRPGTRFEVLRRDASGDLRARGTVEVREVEDAMASVGLVGKPDAFDPMLPGDLVRNPLFHRGESLRYFLLGEFPVSLSKEFVTGRLGELGGHVDSELTVLTDILVVGSRNELDEFATAPEATAEFQMADRLGLRIVRLDELARYLRF